MSFFKKKKTPIENNWFNNFQKDADEFKKKIKDEMIKFNQKHFKKDFGIRIYTIEKNDIHIFSDIEGLEIDDFWFKYFTRKVLVYLNNKSETEAIAFIDALKQEILKHSVPNIIQYNW